jgi:hypothetical protein
MTKNPETIRIVSYAWAFLIALGFSALIHSTDKEIGGLAGFWNLSAIISVIFVAVILLAPMFLCLLVFNRRGKRGFAVVWIVTSLILGVILAMAGSTATTLPEFAVSLAGATGLFAAVLGLGTLPQLLLKKMEDGK